MSDNDDIRLAIEKLDLRLTEMTIYLDRLHKLLVELRDRQELKTYE